MTTYLTRLPDGTIKQVNPFTGTQVWTLPGRAARPLGFTDHTPLPLHPGDRDRVCAFCPDRPLETTPEIARVVSVDGQWRELRDVLANELTDTRAEFRLIPNLFEILSYDYWHLTHGYVPTPASESRRTNYLSTAAGRAHVEALSRIRMGARGCASAIDEPLAEADLQREAVGLFAGNHQVIVARRHFVDGATDDSQLASSGTLTVDEHCAYTDLAIRAMRDLYRDNPAARYVSVFQNWLRPAGSSFDHLHKQVVAIDEFGTQLTREAARLRQEPDLYARWGEQYAAEQGLLIARTPSAVAFAGVGHRYPSMEVHSLVENKSPWELTPDEVRDFSDLLHACHAATGSLCRSTRNGTTSLPRSTSPCRCAQSSSGESRRMPASRAEPRSMSTPSIRGRSARQCRHSCGAWQQRAICPRRWPSADGWAAIRAVSRKMRR